MPDIGLPELVIILVILLLLFGSTKLPKLAKSLGESAGELKRGFDRGVPDEKPTKKEETNKA